MAEVKLTVSQQAVVDDRGGALLVSAAAGSGKTKVLVDRLMKRICDPQVPCNIDDFLVITYTRAAAAELRVKIAQAISERLAKEPENRHLQRQLNRIYLAQISTVHGFCSDLLRTYAHLLDIPADFRVAEEAESSAIGTAVLQNLLELAYANVDQDAGFRAMVDTFGYGRDDRKLPEAILMAHRAMRCHADMTGWLEHNVAVLDMSRYQDAAQTPWGAYLMEEFRQFLAASLRKMRAARTEMTAYPAIEKGLGKVFDTNIAQLEQLQALETWDQLVEGKVLSFGRAGAVSKPEDPAVKSRLANVRTLCWSELKTWQELFSAPSPRILEDLRQVAPGAAALLRFAKTYDEAYREEKKRRKIMDFSDLEHATIRLLVDRHSGQPTATAREIARRYVEIMVDEYQDSNEIQDTIFEAVSKNGTNRFMVGDVKQSIYRFRLAQPEIFLQKYDTYPDYTQAETGRPRRILLSENFRSRPEILAACNDVFRLIMRKRVGDLDYGEAEALRSGRPFPPLRQCPVELHCLTHSSPDAAKTALEAGYVAKRIRRMLDEQMPVSEGEGTRSVKPGDIVILLRSASSAANDYVQALHSLGIPAVCDRGGNLLDTSEVQILVSVLRIIDNPHQDVPLLAAMASPAFGFSPDELARPRTAIRNGDYYDAITATAEPGSKLSSFLQTLAELREDAAWMNLHQLVDSVLRRTGLLAVFASGQDGVAREQNLMAFRAFAVSFEANGSKALPQLLWHLDELQAAGGRLPLPKQSASDAVNIMTIHSSKGLEFPVVFLCDLSRRFNLRDMSDAVLVDGALSVGCNLVDHKRYVRYPTLAKQAIVMKKTAEAVSEELRILYVAMTRPKDMLVMTYYSKSLKKDLEKLNSQLTMPLTDDVCARVRQPGAWILLAALCRTEAGEILKLVDYNDVSRVWDTTWNITYRDLAEETAAAAVADDLPKSVQTAAAAQLLQFRYPFEAVVDVPAKLTATQLKGRVFDKEAAEGAAETLPLPMVSFRKPRFMPHEPDAAARGTATHLFLQFASYEACTNMADAQAELLRLYEEAFLTKEQADAVELSHVVTFFCSDLGQWLLNRRQIRREFKFSLLVDAGTYLPHAAGEKTMLQGVVDCFVIEPDGITILDFKTDRRPDPERYRPQLQAYGEALSRIYRMTIKAQILYFLTVDKEIYL